MPANACPVSAYWGWEMPRLPSVVEALKACGHTDSGACGLLYVGHCCVQAQASTEAPAECVIACVMRSGGDKVKVGICHNVWWLEPKHGGPLYLHVKCASSCMTVILLILSALAVAVAIGEM